MKQNNSFLLMAFPLAIFVIIGLFLFVERTGVIYSTPNPSIKILESGNIPQPSSYAEEKSDCVVYYNGAEASWTVYYEILQQTFSSLRLKCDYLDINSADAQKFTAPVNLDHYKTAVVGFSDGFTDGFLKGLMTWVKNGGKVMFALRPNNSTILQPYIHDLGVRSITTGYIFAKGVKFTSDLFPGAKEVNLPKLDIGEHEGLPVTLEKSVRVHLISSDETKLPLLWDFDNEKGRVVVINTGQFNGKESRGTLAAAYSLLQDVFVYPVINSSTFFIDDFPAPIPSGDDATIRAEYNLDKRDFLLKIWWPDTYALAENYGLKYTGALVETYNNNVTPPFEQYNNMDDFRYMGGYLLKSGGQLGLHGYSHISLCLESDEANEYYGYPSWPSVENMENATKELVNFTHLLFPGKEFSVYVPPSNVLCSDMRQNLPKVVPGLKVISSLYINGDPEESLYVQEFEEAPDGIIELPRIGSGYIISDNVQWGVINELYLHYVNSHFIHPDDAFDDMRSQNKPWKDLYANFEDHVKWLTTSMPGLRQLTAVEGAGAVQRYYRLQVNGNMDGNTYVIKLGHFYDEAWLMLKSNKKPVSIAGGNATPVTSNLYLIHALQPEIRVNY